MEEGLAYLTHQEKEKRARILFSSDLHPTGHTRHTGQTHSTGSCLLPPAAASSAVRRLPSFCLFFVPPIRKHAGTLHRPVCDRLHLSVSGVAHDLLYIW